MNDPDHLVEEFRAESGCSRLFVATYLVPGAIGGLYGGYLLASEVRHWAAWLFSFLVLEPIGIVCLAALLVAFAPDSIATELLRWAVPRAKHAAIIVGALYVVLILALFGFVLIEWVRL